MLENKCLIIDRAHGMCQQTCQPSMGARRSEEGEPRYGAKPKPSVIDFALVPGPSTRAPRTRGALGKETDEPKRQNVFGGDPDRNREDQAECLHTPQRRRGSGGCALSIFVYQVLFCILVESADPLGRGCRPFQPFYLPSFLPSFFPSPFFLSSFLRFF